ncbi:hypothetical protein [Hymenobacter ginkgonis]|nr:hypothetical protein [Hymenobacter ginkgonis]
MAAYEDYPPAAPRHPSYGRYIQLTISWEGNRLRVGTRAVVRPEY